nr:YkgJ family cysteine cluster protein [uncultured Blautia sp.]
MLREIDLDAVSDGRRYRQSDMVKAGCNDCKGCSDCCRNMGSSIVLDPYDCFELCKHLKESFEKLLSYAIELQVVDGIILPNLKMTGGEAVCAFLNEQGRCSIHSFRPGFCRMFPLGRIYEEGDFQYFLQVKECKMEPKTKVKIQKWLGIPNIRHYEEFVKKWHYFLKDVEKILGSFQEETSLKNVSMYLLKNFYLTPYDETEDFYVQFEERLEKAKRYFL